MAKARTSLLLSFLLLVLGSSSAAAQERELLYPESVSGMSARLQEVTATIRNLKSASTHSDQRTRKTEYFVRIAPRKYVFQENRKLKDRAMLGGKPFVFMTTAEGVFGLSLLDIYLGIGYEAEGIISAQRDEDMVMIVFKYPKEIVTSGVNNGLLPDDWDKKVYIPTWENVFALFHRLAALDPSKTNLSQAERDFVLSFSAEGKQRIKKAAYAELKAADGPNWKYRSLLEQKLSVFEHFRGNGQTQNEVRDPDGVEAGLIESVGPNWNVNELPEVAIIHLGKLVMRDSYGVGCTLCGSVSESGNYVGAPSNSISAQPTPTLDASGETAMSLTGFTHILEIIIWPVVALIAILVLRPHLGSLMAGSKVKLSIFGQSIETTLPELEQVIDEQAEGNLTEEQISYVESISNDGVKDYPEGIESEEQKNLLRPVRNAGLIMTVPKDASLSKARGIKLSALGRLYLRARRKGNERDAPAKSLDQRGDRSLT